jgi:hypothetical protein
MTYYLYVPMEEKKVSETLKNTIRDWVSVEKERDEKKKDIVVVYKGKQGLNNLPPYAKIYVFAPGTATEPTPIEKAVGYELARSFDSTSGQFKLFEGKERSLSVPGIVDDMIADGLFSSNAEEDRKNIHIKLFFQNAGKQASRLAKVFEYFLNLNKPASPANVRIDYYPDSHLLVPRKKEDPHKYAIRASKNGFFRANEVRESLFSDGCQPILPIPEVEEAVEKYNRYKSSRFCGLSHFLGLNSWFSSKESASAIQVLLNQDIENEERYNLAKNFVKAYPDNKLTEYLKEIVDFSVDINNERYWTPVQG